MRLTFDDAVEELRRLDREERDAERTLLEVRFEEGDTGAMHPSRLSELARRSRIDEAKLADRVRIATAWPKKYRHVTLAWSIYAELAGHADRFDILERLRGQHGAKLTIDQVRQAMGKAPTRLKAHGNVEDKAAAVVDYLRDGEVRRRVIESEHGEAVIARTSIERHQRDRARAAAGHQAIGPSPAAQVRERMVPLVREVAELRRSFEEALENEVVVDAEDFALMDGHLDAILRLRDELRFRQTWGSAMRSVTEKRR